MLDLQIATRNQNEIQLQLTSVTDFYPSKHIVIFYLYHCNSERESQVLTLPSSSEVMMLWYQTLHAHRHAERQLVT